MTQHRTGRKARPIGAGAHSRLATACWLALLAASGPALAQDAAPADTQAQAQQQAALEHAGWHVGGTHRAEQDGVVPAQLLEHGVGKHLAAREVPRTTEVVVDRVEGHSGGTHDLERFGEDFGSDPVAADHGHPVGHVLPSSLSLSRRLFEATKKPPTHTWTVERERHGWRPLT